jgi:hypothetical protein
MARNDNVNVAPNTWVQLTNANASAIRVQNLSGFPVNLQATVGASAPTSIGGSLRLNAQGVITASETLANLFPGLTGANRVWAFCETGVTLSVSHANA